MNLKNTIPAEHPDFNIILRRLCIRIPANRNQRRIFGIPLTQMDDNILTRHLESLRSAVWEAILSLNHAKLKFLDTWEVIESIEVLSQIMLDRIVMFVLVCEEAEARELMLNKSLGPCPFYRDPP